MTSEGITFNIGLTKSIPSTAVQSSIQVPLKSVFGCKKRSSGDLYLEGFRGCIVFSGECFGIDDCRYGYHCLEVPLCSLSNSYLLLIALLSSYARGPKRLILALPRQNKQYKLFPLDNKSTSLPFLSRKSIYKIRALYGL